MALGIIFLAVGICHRIRAARTGEKLDRSKEGLADSDRNAACGSYDVRIDGSVDLESGVVRMGCVPNS